MDREITSHVGEFMSGPQEPRDRQRIQMELVWTFLSWIVLWTNWPTLASLLDVLSQGQQPTTSCLNTRSLNSRPTPKPGHLPPSPTKTLENQKTGEDKIRCHSTSSAYNTTTCPYTNCGQQCVGSGGIFMRYAGRSVG